LRLADIGLDVVKRDVCELALDVVHGSIQLLLIAVLKRKEGKKKIGKQLRCIWFFYIDFFFLLVFYVKFPECQMMMRKQTIPNKDSTYVMNFQKKKNAFYCIGKKTEIRAPARLLTFPLPDRLSLPLVCLRVHAVEPVKKK
jgi:hypothetical protein